MDDVRRLRLALCMPLNSLALDGHDALDAQS